MEEFGFEDDLFEEKKKNETKRDDQDYIARFEEPLWFKDNNTNIPRQKEDRVIKYQLDNLYLDKQYLSAIDFALSHFHPPLTTEAILQGKKKKKWGGGEVGGEGGGVWGGVGRRLAEVYDILVWCYFNLGDWKMMQQILLALVQLQPNNFVYWRLLGKAQSELGKYEDACASLFWSIKRNVSYLDAWLDTSRNYLRAQNYPLARKCYAHTRWLAQKSARRAWDAYGKRIIAQVDAHTADVAWEDAGREEVKFHPNEEIAKMEKEFLKKKHDDVDEVEEEDDVDNPLRL